MLTVSTQFLFITIALQEFQWCHQTRAQVDAKETQPHLSVTPDPDSTSGDGTTKLATSLEFKGDGKELGDRPARAPIISATLDPGNRSPAWYLSFLAGLNESFFWSNRTYSEFLEFEGMLREIPYIIDPYQFIYQLGAIEVLNVAYKMVSSPEMTATVSEFNLCSQPDVLKRISCRDRCGELPESRELPVQCGCDQDCFMHGDCCEDMNKLCTDIFELATTKFYEHRENFFVTQCYKSENYMLFKIFDSERLNSSVEPRVFEIDCHSEIHKDDALQNIFNAMRKADCTFKSIFMDKVISSRLCDRPDILVCGSEKSPDEFTFYPIHLLCFGHPKTLRLFTRYRNGPDGMEIIAQRGNCSHLRQTVRDEADILTNNDNKKKVWQKSQLKKLKLTVVTRNGQTFFNFETAKWGKLRCAGGMTISDWGCEVIECSDNQFFDDISQTCYWPDYAYMQVTESRTDASCSDNSATSTSIRQSPADKAASSFNVQLCPCLEAQVVLQAVRLWQVLADTSALVDGRCGFKLAANPQEQLLFIRSEGGGNDSRNWNDTASTGASAIGDTRSGTAQTGNISVVSFLSQQLPSLWSNRRNECAETEYVNVKICLANIVWRDVETTCFTLQDTSPETRDSCVRGLYNMGLRYSLRYDHLLSLLIVNVLNLIVKFIE